MIDQGVSTADFPVVSVVFTTHQRAHAAIRPDISGGFKSRYHHCTFFDYPVDLLNFGINGIGRGGSNRCRPENRNRSTGYQDIGIRGQALPVDNLMSQPVLGNQQTSLGVNYMDRDVG